MKCSELKPNDIVVFYVTIYAREKEEVYDGNVIYVDNERKSVCVCYLGGYKSRSVVIPFEKMIAKHDENGEEMLFGGWIRGKSVLLGPERRTHEIIRGIKALP